MHSTTDYSPFKIVYSFIPLTPLYFIILLLMKGLVLMVKKKKNTGGEKFTYKDTTINRETNEQLHSRQNENTNWYGLNKRLGVCVCI
jgi:hypothetical protein